MQETWVQSLGGEDSLEEGMATHFRILAWRIPMDKEKPGGLVHGVAKSDTTKHGGRGWGGRQREGAASELTRLPLFSRQFRSLFFGSILAPAHSPQGPSPVLAEDSEGEG